jgi:hypothetical protein
VETCDATVGPASTVDCSNLTHCAVQCTGDCVVYCTSLSTCAVTCADGSAATECPDGVARVCDAPCP